MSELHTRTCVSCEGGVPRLTAAQVEAFHVQVPKWAVCEDAALERTFRFENYWQTMAFTNAVAWIAHQEDHHPDLSVHYNHVVVRWSTHAVSGLTENDFIAAAKVDRLFHVVA